MVLLLVEDDVHVARALARGLGDDGFHVEHIREGAAAVTRLARHDIDAVVLDLGLPDIDGLDVLRGARADGLVAPVLVLTARDTVETRVRALDLGADDYVAKPFAHAELVARLHALARRAAAPRWAPLACNGVVLAPDSPSMTVDGRTVALSPREHALLGILLRRRGEPIARAMLLRQVFGYRFDPGTNLVDVHVANLRKKLRDADVRIEAVRGVGYVLRASV